MAEAEINKKEKSQREGSRTKKDWSGWNDYGRSRTMPLDDFAKEYEVVQKGKMRHCELMKKLSMTKPIYYRYVQGISERGR